MTTAKKFLETAAKYIGTYGDHNKFNKWYWVTYTKTYSSDPGTAWCANFMSYVAFEAGLKCSYSASAAGFATQFERIPVKDEGSVKPGDIVVFNWDGRTDTGWCDHVGVVEWSSIAADGSFGTIEGNTGNRAEGEVLRVTRNNWSNYFTAFYRPKYDAEASTKSVANTAKKAVEAVKKAVTKSQPKTKLYGIDVSGDHNQPADICSKVAYDFAFVKVSGNPHGYSWNYVNPDRKQQAADVVKRGKKLGLYAFTYGKSDPTQEAKLFLDEVKKLGYLGKAVLCIDYEAQAVDLGRNWVKKYADYIKKVAGYSPVIYASGGVIVAQKLFDLGYPIWCANYYRGYEEVVGYDTSMMKIYSGCEKSVLWQFTSSGYLKGYDGPLDLDVFFGSTEDWDKLAGVKAAAKPATKPAATPKKNEAEKSPARKSVETLAKEVIAGKWGVGDDRRKRLEKAGYSYQKVQDKVNELLGAKNGKSIEQLAQEVIRGEWGDGEDRREALERAGYSYEDVQDRVNEILS